MVPARLTERNGLGCPWRDLHLRSAAVFDFAHGDTMAFGTMVTIRFTWWFQSMGITGGPLPTALLALPFSIAITAGLLRLTRQDRLRLLSQEKGTADHSGHCLRRGDVHHERI